MVVCHFQSLLTRKGQREKRRISLRRCALETGLSRYTVSQLAGGHLSYIPVSLIEALCVYLDCTVGDLFEVIPDQGQEKGA